MIRIVSVLGLLLFGLSGMVDTYASSTSDEVVTAAKPRTTMSQKESWKLMVGKWYGSQPMKNGGKREQIVERRIDGTYKTTFRAHYPRKGVREVTEVGNWGIAGPIYFSIYRGRLKNAKFKKSDPSNPHNYDAYHIKKLNNEVFEYQGVVTGSKYTVKRVSIDFEFPKLGKSREHDDA